MPAPTMKRWENIVALAATVLAAGALLPIAPYRGSSARGRRS